MNNDIYITDVTEKEMAGADLHAGNIYRSHLSAYDSHIDDDYFDDEDDEYYPGGV